MRRASRRCSPTASSRSLPRGISYLYMGKTGMYSAAGSRNQVLWDPFNVFAAYRYLTTGGAAQEALGGQQTAWLQGTMLQSPATWKVLGSSVMLTPLLVDFTNPLIASQLPDGFPDELRTRLGITMDGWDGFPQKKLELLGLLDVVPNAVVISGDIHSTFVTDHTNGVFEFTSSAVSSATIGDEVANRIASDPILGQFPGLEELVENLGAAAADLDRRRRGHTVGHRLRQHQLARLHGDGGRPRRTARHDLRDRDRRDLQQLLRRPGGARRPVLDGQYRVQDGELIPGG